MKSNKLRKNIYLNRNQKGITLVALIITIVILLILAVVAISSIQNDGIIFQAEQSAFISKVKKYEEELVLYINEKKLESLLKFDQTSLTANKTTVPSIKDIIKSITEVDEENFIIQEGNLLYVGENEQQKEICQNLGVGVSKSIKKIYGNSVQNGAPSTTNPVEIQNVGDKTRNLLDLNIFNCTEQTINGLTFTPIGENKIHVTGTATDTSIRTQYRGYCSTKEMQLPAGTYIISGSTSELDAMVGVYSNLTNSFIANISNKATTLTEDGYAYYFLINISAGTTRTFDDVIQVQVEEGSTATEYEPYGYKIPVKVSNGTEKITTNVYLDEPLRKIGDYVDYIDFENKQVVRNIKELILDGSTHKFGGLSSSCNNRATFRLGDNLSNNYTQDNAYCTHFNYNTTVYRDTAYDELGFIIDRDLCYFRFISSSDINSLTLANEWLVEQYNNGTPMKIQYILATPDPQPIELPNIPTLKGTTVLSVDTTIQPSNIEK